jgi:PAS domain S-box-containing protein/putative nucleotidyltransferase with HDIG domain
MKRVSKYRKNKEAKQPGEKRVNPARNTIHDSRSYYRRIFESARYGILIVHAKTGRIEDANHYILNLLGYSLDELVRKTAWQLHSDPESARHRFEKMLEKGIDHWDDLPLAAANGSMTPVDINCSVYQAGRKKLVQYNIRGITALKRTEKSLHNLSHAIDASGDAVFMTDKDGIFTSINQRFTDLYGYMPEEVIGKVTPRILKSGVQNPEFYIQFWKTILQNELVSGEVINKTKDGRLVFIEETVNPFLDDHGKVAGFLAIQRNVTERKKAEENVRRKLSHLKALREIDLAIASSFAMQINLAVLLKHTIAELGADAADVLLLNPNLNRLEYAAGSGFRTLAIGKSNLPMGDSHAGQAATQRIMVHVEDLRWSEHPFARADLLAGEEFVSYFGVPLIAKGLVKGVLEVFHRSSLEPDHEWIDFLHTLAGQAAIAIEDAQLFHNLQQSNFELLQAYDATIEGWSRALDLRDKETEGHTQRVTEMAMMLGQKIGLSDQELKFMRWGGLLHDIGKMAVPDKILLKPDALTPEEMDIMKQHPSYALQMLSPIHYLKLALDIPYCHHEHWDGSGYPRGLKQEEIPLVARIFAVADVFDALTSDRPYRDRWAESRALDYIHQQSGSYFDPQVVDVFLQMMGKPAR